MAAPYSTNSCMCVPIKFLVTRDPVEVGPLSRGIMLLVLSITPIRPITERPSLPPPSFTRRSIGSPYGSPSLAAPRPEPRPGLRLSEGGRRAYHVPLVYPRGLDPSSTPGVLRLR